MWLQGEYLQGPWVAGWMSAPEWSLPQPALVPEVPPPLLLCPCCLSLLFLTPPPAQHFCYFSMFSQRDHKPHWHAPAWPMVGPLQSWLCPAQGSPWPLLIDASPAALPSYWNLAMETQYSELLGLELSDLNILAVFRDGLQILEESKKLS